MRLPPHLTHGAGELHRAIVEQAQDAIIFADREGVILRDRRLAIGRDGTTRHLEEIARCVGADTHADH